jgi:phage/plasmid-like protein (TIGR03299 family)
MAHNIEFNTEKNTHSFVSNRVPAWHGLGTIVETAMNWEQAMTLANLNFEVNKVQMKNPVTDELVESWGIIRSDNNAFLGSVGKQYTPIQNKFLFNFIDEIVGQDGFHYETAGVLGKGERVFVMAKADSYDVLATGDRHDTYLLGVGSHDGTMSQTFKMTSTRVVCQNTLNIALSEKGTAVKAKHTVNGEAKLSNALKLIQQTRATALNTQQIMEELAQRRVTTQAIANTLSKLFNIKSVDTKIPTVTLNQVEQVKDLFESNDRDAFPEFRGTAYNLLNSLTEYADHYRNVRGGADADTQRAVSAMFGTGDKFKTQAMELVLELTAGAQRTNQPKAFSLPSDNASLLDSILESEVIG